MTGRGTGIPIIRKEMAKNGSPEPRFETDENYSYFITTLPIQPAFLSDEGVSEGVNEGVFVADNKQDIIQMFIREGVSEGVNEGVNGTVHDILSILLN